MWIFNRRLVRVTLTRYILGLLPLVSSHGYRQRFCEGFLVSFYKWLSVVAYFLMGFHPKAGSSVSRLLALLLVGGPST